MAEAFSRVLSNSGGMSMNKRLTICFTLLTLSIVLLLSACSTALDEANLEAIATPRINPNSPYILPPDGRQTAVTCQGIAGKTTIRTLRISGSIAGDDIRPTFENLGGKFSVSWDIPFSRTRDTSLHDASGPQGRAAFVKNLANKNVAVLEWGSGLQIPIPNIRPDLGINSDSFILAELIKPGQEPTGDSVRERKFFAGTTAFNKLFPPIYGPIAASGEEFAAAHYFVLVLEESKGYAAGRGYLLELNNLLAQGQYPNGPYFESQGLGVLNGPDVFGQFNCRLNIYDTN
jgi:hypothetical protein